MFDRYEKIDYSRNIHLNQVTRYNDYPFIEFGTNIVFTHPPFLEPDGFGIFLKLGGQYIHIRFTF